MNNDSQTGLSLSESFLRAMAPPLEADIYQSHMKQALWSIDEFSALMAGLTPENYKKGTKGSTLITDEIFVKREAFATQIFSQFLDYMKKTMYSKILQPLITKKKKALEAGLLDENITSDYPIS